MQYEEHGGGCCGIMHIMGLSDIVSDGEVIQTLLDEMAEDGNDYGVIEAVAADYQLELDDGKIAKALKESGFVLVNRVHNPNSGNYINIFHKFKDAEAGNLSADSPINRKKPKESK